MYLGHMTPLICLSFCDNWAHAVIFVKGALQPIENLHRTLCPCMEFHNIMNNYYLGHDCST